MQIALLWSLPLLLYKANDWNEYVISRCIPLFISAYWRWLFIVLLVIGHMFTLFPTRACTWAMQVHIEFAVDKESHCTCPSAAINFLYPVASPTIRYCEILGPSRCVFITELLKRARNSAAYVLRMCDPDDPDELRANANATFFSFVRQFRSTLVDPCGVLSAVLLRAFLKHFILIRLRAHEFRSIWFRSDCILPYERMFNLPWCFRLILDRVLHMILGDTQR